MLCLGGFGRNRREGSLMRNSYRFSPFPLIAFFLSSCGTVTIPVTPTFHEGSRADGVVKIALEVEPEWFRNTQIESFEGTERAVEICRGWGYKNAVNGDEIVENTQQGTSECIHMSNYGFGSACSRYRLIWTYICTSRAPLEWRAGDEANSEALESLRKRTLLNCRRHPT